MNAAVHSIQEGIHSIFCFPYSGISIGQISRERCISSLTMLGNNFIKCQIGDMISLCRSRLFKTVAQHSRSACLSSTPGSVEFGRIQSSSNPQLPLCERSAEYIESAATVSKWFREVSNSLVQVGDELQKDGGPTYDDLVIELGWLMEDAVVGWKEFAASAEHKMACTGSGKSREDAMLKLRISIVELRTCV